MKSKKLIYFIITLLCVSTFLTILTYNSLSLNTDYLPETKDLRRSQGKIFNNMYANYTFDVTIAGDYNTTFEWNRVSGDIYNVTWEIPGEGIATWLEDKQTRIISNASGPFCFNDATHTPIWIFTNLTIGNFTWIAIDGEPDHLFEVVGEFNVTLPDIGTYETWVLQDTSYPGSIAFYEKSTGLLMAGIFEFWFGTEDYTLVLTATNMFSHYQAESKGFIPGYDPFLLIPFIAIISLLIFIRKRKK